MSDTITTRSRLFLLTSVSVLALVSLACASETAAAGDSPVWVDLGWQSNRIYNSKESALPLGSLVPALPASLADSLSLKPSGDSYGKISFQPEGTGWVLSASVTYGRTHGRSPGLPHDIATGVPPRTFVTYHTTIPTYPFPFHRTAHGTVAEKSNYVAVGRMLQSDSHLIVDFQAGRDVGLGMLGESTLSAGLRIVNFRSSLIVSSVQGVQDVQYGHVQHQHPTYAFFPSSVRIVPWYFNFYNNNWRSLLGAGNTSTRFNGIGPSIHWDASTPIFGNAQHGGEVLIDWGVNAAILFGRRAYTLEHHATSNYHCAGRYCGTQPVHSTADTVRNGKNTTVPNLGGTIGLSYRLDRVKISLGYRGDFFFHALSAGAQGSSTRGFRGPFAGVSVGIGD